jgi:hypothetical protein
METKITPPWMKGIVISLVCIVYGLILYFAGQSQNKSLGWIQFVILMAGIIWSCINFAKQMDGNVTFGNVFAHGFKVTAAVAAILAVYSFLAFKFIYPEMIDISLEEARKSMEAKNNLSEDQVQQSLTMVRKFFIPFAIGGVLIGTAILGAIAALIGAGVAKKNPNPFVDQQ